MHDNIQGDVLAVTDAAILVDVNDFGELWIPKSLIDSDGDYYEKGDYFDDDVAHWFLEKEGVL